MAEAIRIETTLHRADHRRMLHQCARHFCTARAFIRAAVLEKLERQRDSAPKVGSR